MSLTSQDTVHRSHRRAPRGPLLRIALAAVVALLAIGWSLESDTRIFLIGDSTMADKSLVDDPEHGWGQMLPLFFNDDVQIFNRARNGRSTKSFIDEGRWTAVVEELHAGDYVFIQFGHNDAKKEDSTRYALPRPVYRDNLLRFVHEARAKGATPVLFTPVTRREFDSTGHYRGTHGDYPDVVREVARNENVPMIDMFEKSKALVSTLGDRDSRSLYLAGVKTAEYRSWDKKRDDTHFTRPGAIRMAGLAVEGIRELRLALASSLKQNPPPPMAGPAKVVGLDYFFNNEWREGKNGERERFHYTWEDTTNSGFSQLARILDLQGADLDTLQTAPTDALLDRVSVYVIIDPDTPAETEHPHFIDDGSIDVILRWVDRGGVLALFGNDKGNVEFEHFNRLAERFGIHFNEDSEHKVVGTAFETGANDRLPDHPMFKGVH